MCVADACLRRDQRNAFDTHRTLPGDHQRNDRTIDVLCVAEACLRRDQRNAFDTHRTPPGDRQRNDRTIDIVSLTKM